MYLGVVISVNYRVVDLCTCRFCHSSFEDKYRVLSERLKNDPIVKRYFSNIILYADQEDFGAHNPIYVGDKITDADISTAGSIPDLNLFEVLDIQYGYTIETDEDGTSLFLELHPKVRGVFRGAARILPTPPESDTTSEDNEDNNEEGD